MSEGFKKNKLTFYLILISVLFLLINVYLLITKSLVTKTTSSPFPSAKPSASADFYQGLPSLPPEFLSPDEQIKRTPIDNPFFVKEIENIYTQKPWLKKLPITTKSYIIVFDWEKQAIIIIIIIDSTVSSDREKQIEEIKKEATKNLEAIGVDLEKEKFYYTFTP